MLIADFIAVFMCSDLIYTYDVLDHAAEWKVHSGYMSMVSLLASAKAEKL